MPDVQTEKIDEGLHAEAVAAAAEDPRDQALTDADRLLIADAAIENMRREMEELRQRIGPAAAAPPTSEARERDILLRAEAVEALREIRKSWAAIQETGGIDRVEIKSGKNDPSGWNPALYLPVYRKLEVPLRQLAAEWMARFVTAAEALCLDVIERGEMAVPEPEKAPAARKEAP